MKTPLYEVFAGRDHPSLAFRVVDQCPPTTRDFTSYEALGKSYNRRDFFRGVGVSMYRTPAAAASAAKRFRLGPTVAHVDLAADGIVWTASGRNDHITVWAAPQLLLSRVLQCEPHG